MTMEEIWDSLSNEAKEYLTYKSKATPKKWVAEITEYLEGHKFKHTNGNIYTVLFLTNTQAEPERWKDHPIDVIYEGANGNKWSRPLSDWFRSFTKITI
jgi:hypothetical protein